ncbi:MAG: cell division protein FtsA [Leuconostoc fallax]
MNDSGVTVGIDIGTTSIKVVISQLIGNQFNIIGAGIAQSRGLRRGIIVDIDATANAIREAVDQAQEKANYQIKDVVVGIAANQLEIIKVDGLVSVANQNKRITYQDVQAVAEQALSRSMPADRDVIDLVPDEFIVDGFDAIKDPHEMIGVRLEMRGTAYVGPSKIIDNTRMAIQKAGLVLKEFVLAPLAMGNSILDDGEQDFGTVLIDLGGGQTTVSVIHDRKLKFTYVDPEGGDYVTHDISTVLGTSYGNAEKLKRNYGFADPSQASADNEFPVAIVGEPNPKLVDEKYLAEIIAARLEQIYSNIYQHLSQINALQLPGGFVLTGGNAALPRMADFAKKILGENVRLFVPDQIGLRHPSYARAMAYALYASRENMTQLVIKQVIMSRREPEITAYPNQVIETNNNEPADTRLIVNDQYAGDSHESTNQSWFAKARQKLSNLFED